MNSVRIGHFCIFIIFCYGAKFLIRNEIPSKKRDEMQIFELYFAL